MTEQGSIVLDRRDHYAGVVKTRRAAMGCLPIQETIKIEDRRYAACTSPQD